MKIKFFLHLSKLKKIHLVFIVPLVLLIIFFFPKIYYDQIDQGTLSSIRKECSHCLGVTYDPFGSDQSDRITLCFGIPYQCQKYKDDNRFIYDLSKNLFLTLTLPVNFSRSRDREGQEGNLVMSSLSNADQTMTISYYQKLNAPNQQGIISKEDILIDQAPFIIEKSSPDTCFSHIYPQNNNSGISVEISYHCKNPQDQEILKKTLSTIKFSPELKAILQSTRFVKPTPSTLPLYTPTQVSSAINPERKNWYDKIKWDRDCETAFQKTSTDTSFSGITTYNLEKDKTIIIVQCALGAYQPSQILYLYWPSREISQLSLDCVDGNGELFNTGSEIFGLLTFEPQTQTLTNFHKFAGHGGCGYLANYKLVRDNFQLIKFNSNTDCFHPLLPDNWPSFPIPTISQSSETH